MSSNYFSAPETVTVIVEKGRRGAPDVTKTWKNRPPISSSNRGRPAAPNIRNVQPGPTAASSGIRTESEAWRRFLTDDIIREIITWTNQKIEKFRENKTEEQLAALRGNCRNTDFVEMSAFLGTLYLIACLAPPGWDKRRLWSDAGHPWFRGICGKNRFKFLLAKVGREGGWVLMFRLSVK